MLSITGDDGAIVCTGVVVQYALEASKQIENETGRKIRVVDMYSLKPIDRKAVVDAAKTGCLVVAQDHNVCGGLGSIVGTVVAEEGLRVKMKILGFPDKFTAMAHAPYLYEKFGYDVSGLKKAVQNLY